MPTKITRPKEGRLVGGVCQGIANAFDWDPTIVRIIAGVLILAAGSGPLIYLLLWAIIPDEASGTSAASTFVDKARSNTQASGRTTTRPDDTFNPYRGD
ncbi:PspC domain-containing protein [Cutibacterium sp. WCA-380-WT-3A]|uniref:PspC domain-containing protein n=1 Tax=Cutibacterium porci TaxID=2605781 RepID=A0A7K0J7V8_9ACTN|nr:PspC domain-containing protein [Cutibacterium porci]MSS46019.1 PspC domain-containing protein [Cutibacterium porci]